MRARDVRIGVFAKDIDLGALISPDPQRFL